ncbi:hypothetical protein GCM10011579_036330 [Streptomyces albiflavescens]|uniref:Uncharacterized protein n=1 Tax=Streptomyces albiflavescens TaxID=1623582 RepID=A0A917Y312_9ACTN|nr:hypothetical protein [Streptomyces albiflavescens]GGN65666.1 hypothetical protein GCM10011579_036330 [Streptomyces albiflavescens]
MAHAAPVPKPPRIPTPSTPDVFDERTHAIARWAIPVVGGLVYGYWTAGINRDGGPITGWNVLFGFVSAIAFAALYIGVRLVAPLLKRELHAVLWSAFAGITFGFMYSQTGSSVLRSTFMALAVAAGVFVLAFYRYYTHEDAEGHPDPR